MMVTDALVPNKRLYMSNYYYVDGSEYCMNYIGHFACPFFYGKNVSSRGIDYEDKKAIFFHEKRFQFAVPARCSEIIYVYI